MPRTRRQDSFIRGGATYGNERIKIGNDSGRCQITILATNDGQIQFELKLIFWNGKENPPLEVWRLN